jgi:putative oxidoreductase
MTAPASALRNLTISGKPCAAVASAGTRAVACAGHPLIFQIEVYASSPRVGLVRLRALAAAVRVAIAALASVLMTRSCQASREEEAIKADALIRFMLLGNRSWEEFAILLARISLGAFFAISGGNKLFVAAHTREMYETIAGAGIPFPHVMAYFVSSVEFICGSLLIIGLLSSLCCIAFIFDMIVAIATLRLATIAKGLSFIDWLDDFLYLPEVLYIIIFIWLICAGPGRVSVDHAVVRQITPSAGRRL